MKILFIFKNYENNYSGQTRQIKLERFQHGRL
jgi:hypothetical protein